MSFQTETNEEIMNLKFSFNEGESLFFRVRDTTPMQIAMDEFAQRAKTPVNLLKFTLNGNRIRGTATPKELGVTSEDQIEVFLESIGGGPEDDNPPRTIKLRVREQQTQEETMFRIKTTDKLSKIFYAFSERKGLPRTDYRFLFDGLRLTDNETPQKYDMEDDDLIDAHLNYDGGLLRSN